MTPDELRELELAENQQRLDLSSYEESKQRQREIEAAKEEVESQPAQSAQPRPQHRKRRDAEVSRRTGIPRDEIRRTRQHVETAEEHPAFQGKEWMP